MSTNPLSPPRLRSTLPVVDIGGFFDAVDSALQLHLKTTDWPAGTQPTLVHDFPKERLARADDPFDVITFHVRGAEMAPTSNDGSRVPIRPIIRETVASNTQSNYNVKSFAWKELVEIVFTIHSRSNRRADMITNWFHRFMMKWGHAFRFFEARGVDRFQFVGRLEDKQISAMTDQEVYERYLIYGLRIEYVDSLLERQLTDVTINIGVDRQTDTIERP